MWGVDKEPGYPALHPDYSGPRIAAIHGLFARCHILSFGFNCCSPLSSPNSLYWLSAQLSGHFKSPYSEIPIAMK